MRSSVALISISAFWAFASAQLDITEKFDHENATSIVLRAQGLADSIINDFYKRRAVGSPPGLFWSRPEFADGIELPWAQSAAVWDALIANVNLTGNTTYTDIITEGLYHQIGPDESFMPPNQSLGLSNQAQAQWALAALSAAEFNIPSPKDKPDFKTLAQNVFDTQVQRWDTDSPCKGGLREAIFGFDEYYNITSGFAVSSFFKLSARLAKLTGNETYSEWANKAYKWAEDQGFITDDFNVYDWSTGEQDSCEVVATSSTSRVLGSWIEGSAVMYNATTSAEWKDRITKFLNQTSLYRESAQSPNIDQSCSRNFNTSNKTLGGECGMGNTVRYARSLSCTISLAPFTSEVLTPMLKFSADQALSHCSMVNSDFQGNRWDLQFACSSSWTEDIEGIDVSSTGSAAALEVVQGLLFNPAMKQQVQEITANKTQSGAAPKETGAAGRMVGSAGVAAMAAMVVAALLA